MLTANHATIGLASNRLKARRRNSSIHSGSFFISDISRTTVSERPFFGLKT